MTHQKWSEAQLGYAVGKNVAPIFFGTKPNLTSFSGNKAPASAGQPIEKGEKFPPSYSLNLNMFRKIKFAINIK